MKVLIAGASGYIGSRLSSYLADQGFEVIALCNKNIPTDNSWVNKMHLVLKIDISSTLAVQGIELHKVDAIVNLVSLDHYQSNGNPDHVNAVNVTSSWNLLETFLKRGIKKYIYFSTIHVYGNDLNGKLTEETLTKPANKYGLTHLLSEKVTEYYASIDPVNCTNIRLSNGYGAPFFMSNKCWDLVINNLCLGVWKTQKIVLKSDGSPLRDFIHLEDILIGVRQLLLHPFERDKKTANIINFSSGKTISMLDAAMIVKSVYEEKYGRKAEVFINEDQILKEYFRINFDNYELVNERFIKLLGHEGLLELDKGITEIFEFLDHN